MIYHNGFERKNFLFLFSHFVNFISYIKNFRLKLRKGSTKLLKKRFKIFVDVKTLCSDVNAPEKVASVPKDKHYRTPLSVLAKLILKCLHLLTPTLAGCLCEDVRS